MDPAGSEPLRSEGAHFVIRAMEAALAKHGQPVSFRQAMACELNPEKRAWIASVLGQRLGLGPRPEFPDAVCIFENIEQMRDSTAQCATHGCACPVPHVDLLIVGTSCKDMSRATPGYAAQPVLAQAGATCP